MDGTILYWNRAAEKLFGRTRDEALGKNIDIILPSRLAAAFRAMLVDAAAAPRANRKRY
jgi:PAS domain S-box-containing protein